MIFDLEVIENEKIKTIYFDNISNRFFDGESNRQLLTDIAVANYRKHDKYYTVNLSDIGIFYINLGLKCNFACKYCHQNSFRNKTRVVDFLPRYVAKFVKILEVSRPKMKSIAFWGGEPLVYWKTLKVLIPELRRLYPNTKINFPTNGSLLNADKLSFLDKYKIGFYISYDGKNSNRSVSIFDDPKLIKALQDSGKSIGIMPTQNKLSVPIEEIKTELLNYKIPISSISAYSIARCNPYNRDQALDILIPKSKRFERSECIYNILHSINEEKDLYRGLFDRLNFLLGVFCRGLGVDSTDISFCGNSTGRDICVDCTGNIFNCMNIPMHVMGNLLSSPQNLISDVFKNHLTKTKCLACPFVSCCKGGCPLIHDENSLEFQVNCKNLKIIAVPFFRTLIERLLGVYLKRIIRSEDRQLIAEF